MTTTTKEQKLIQRQGANPVKNSSNTFVLSAKQEMILRNLAACEPFTGLLLDRRYKQTAALLTAWRFAEGIETESDDGDEGGHGRVVYVITERGRMALKKAERDRRKQTH